MMNRQFPLHEIAARALIARMESGEQLFGRPSYPPFNALTGKNYRGLSAIWLGMQSYQDPRWMSLRQVNLQRMKVPKGSQGTLISFLKSTEIKPVLDASGVHKKDSKGKTVYETVVLDQVMEKTAWIFNAQQMDKVTDLAKSLEKHKKVQDTPSYERVNTLLENSGAKIEHQGKEAFYEAVSDVIRLPAKQDFPDPDQYYSVALYELAHWTGHQSRLDRSDLIAEPSGPIVEQMRAVLATVLTSRELGIDSGVLDNMVDKESWTAILTLMPFELATAATDAQKIADMLLGFSKKRELEPALNTAELSPSLRKGDQINHKDMSFQVTEEMKNNQVRVFNQTTGEKLKLNPSHGLYKALLLAKGVAVVPNKTEGLGKNVAESIKIPTGMLSENQAKRTGIRR